MPTISELPAATSVAPDDRIPVSQNGVARAVPIGALLAGTQPEITLESGALLGRTSLGAGGPEPVTVGAGLVVNDGTLATADGPLRSLVPGDTLNPDDQVVIERDGQLMTFPLAVLRSLFSAGSHIAINETGVVSAVWPTVEQLGISESADVATQPRITNVSATDIISICRAGAQRSISVSDLLRGITIDQASSAAVAADGDLIWVAQNGNVMTRQSFSAIWNWILTKTTSIHRQFVELTTDTVLDTTVHNGRILVCSQPLTLTPILANMGTGFHCEVVNLSSGDVTFGPGVRTSSGTNVLSAGRAGSIYSISYSFGSVTYASIPEVRSPVLPPGPVQSIALVDVTPSTVALTWLPPSDGTPPYTYGVQYREAGSGSWRIAITDLADLKYTVGGLLPEMQYDFSVVAFNVAGTSALSSIAQCTTLSGPPLPGSVTSISAVSESSTSIQVAWQAAASGGPVESYSLQYRPSGSATWSGNLVGIVSTTYIVTGLTAGTAYEFRIVGTNSSGLGPYSSIIGATTAAQVGSVASVQWNLAPTGPYTVGSGSIGVNAFVSPADAPIRFGFSQSTTTRPATWTAALHVTNDIWGAYVPTPTSAGTWFAWAEGIDGSATNVLPISFTVQ